jgi:hypothetical protein
VNAATHTNTCSAKHQTNKQILQNLFLPTIRSDVCSNKEENKQRQRNQVKARETEKTAKRKAHQ